MVARIHIPERVTRDEPFEVRVLIQHPMETGYRFDADGTAVAKNVIHTLTVHFQSQLVWRAQLGTGVAANPYFQFWLKVPDSGELRVTWLDDQNQGASESRRVRVA